MSLTCLDTLIGLSAVSHDCFTDDEPEGFATSDSGYYITDQDFGITLMDGSAVDGWTILAAAREQAIREFKTDLLAAIRTRFDSSVSPFNGYVGKLKFTGTKTVQNDFLGIRLRTKRQKGLRFVLEKCLLGLNTSGTYSVTITSNDPLFVSPAALNVVHTANTFNGTVWPSTGISLPLWSDSCDEDWLEYYIAFDRNGATPLNNSLTCCNNKRQDWASHFAASGFSADSNTPETTGSFSSDGHGMSLKGYMTCETLDWICELETLNGLDFRDAIARNIQQRAAAIACAMLLESPKIGVGGNFNASLLTDRRNFLNGRYSENTKWISENIPKGVTDCFKCKPINKFHTSKLLV